MHRTYTYKIMPNKKLERKFYEWCGVCRYVYNTAKEAKDESYNKGVILSKNDLYKQLTDSKQEFKFLYNVNNHVLQETIDRLDDAYKRFFSNLKRGKICSKPKWASKKNWKSIPFRTTRIVDNKFYLPSLGKIKVFNFKEPKGDLKNSCIIKEADGLYLKVVVYVPTIETERDSQSIVAIDMGIKYFLTTSDGEFVNNPKHLFKRVKELRLQQRKLSRMQKGGSNWKKQVDFIKRIHQKVKRVRMDFLHKKSKELSNQYDFIVVEDLNIKGMSKNTKLSKHILDCSWGLFFSLISYKTQIIKVNPRYSSQECNKCGHTCKENRKTQSIFECVKCSYTENADLQAAFNLLSRGHSVLGGNVSH